MQQVVTVGLDGSPASLAAARWAADEAEKRKLTLRLLHAWPLLAPEPARLPSEIDQNYWAKRLVHTAQAELQTRHPGLTVVGSLIAEDAHDALLHAASEVGLTVRAGDRTLVDDVSFTIGAGQIVGLVGESGSGKSTIAMAVAGLLPEGVRANASRLALGDLDLLAAPQARRLATEIGIVYQDPIGTFNPALRLGAQLTEVARVHLGKPRRQAARDMVRALADIHVTEPERRLRQHPHELSGGMLQRASIASAMTTNPRLLIADEPTTALDVTVQAEVLRQFRRINREHGTAMLFISHDIGVVGVLCDTVLVLHGGRVVDRTTGADLRRGTVTHPYTRALLAATPAAVEAGETLSAVRWTADAPCAQPDGALSDDLSDDLSDRLSDDLSDRAADRPPAAEGSR
ncbi:ATP-binding cassette domain-containing protein [Streptomyces sp. NPDC002491]